MEDKIEEYKVGDKVKIVSNLICNETGMLAEDKKKYAGKIATIISFLGTFGTNKHSVNLDIDNGRYIWKSSWFRKPYEKMSYDECAFIVKTLKIGQKVKIKDFDIDFDDGFSEYISGMQKYAGKEATIKEIHFSSVSLDIDNYVYSWSPDMFNVIKEEMTEEKARELILKLKVGQKVIIKDIHDITKNGVLIVTDEMQKLSGHTATITKIILGDKPRVKLDADNNDWRWTPDLFDVIEDKKTEGEKGMKNITFNGKTIKRVLFNDDATIVFFNDGTKSVTRRQHNEPNDNEKGLAMALVKSVYGKNFYPDIFGTFLTTAESAKSDPNIPFKIGEKVRIKSWDKMIKEFGKPDIDGDIYIKGEGIYFSNEMKHICGKVFTIRSFNTNYSGQERIEFEENLKEYDLDEYAFSKGMLEHAD